MNEPVIELSSGHVFAPGSVKAIGPLHYSVSEASFFIYGVGFVVRLEEDYLYPIDRDTGKKIEKWKALHQEAIVKLLGRVLDD